MLGGAGPKWEHVEGLDNIMKTPGNFKQIYFDMVFWLQPSCFLPLLSYSFRGNFVLEMAIELCRNFRSRILVILPNNLLKSPTVPIRQLSLPSRVLLQSESFSFFLKCCYYFQDSSPSYTKYFIGFCDTSAYHTSTNNLTSSKVW